MLLRKLKRALKIAVLGLAGLAAVVYGLDDAVFRIRVAANWNPYGSVTVQPYYAVAQKSGKTQFIFQEPQPQTCIHALLPHASYSTCWYLSRHPEPRTDI
ncbi:MAG TPA: hypothetical protein VKR60_01845 [Candidatus Sulfotelmatobacter sp.]|nr:hypothetical protein [Candidatus Sulfotelmatobacter sp.]